MFAINSRFDRPGWTPTPTAANPSPQLVQLLPSPHYDLAPSKVLSNFSIISHLHSYTPTLLRSYTPGMEHIKIPSPSAILDPPPPPPPPPRDPLPPSSVPKTKKPSNPTNKLKQSKSRNGTVSPFSTHLTDRKMNASSQPTCIYLYAQCADLLILPLQAVLPARPNGSNAMSPSQHASSARSGMWNVAATRRTTNGDRSRRVTSSGRPPPNPRKVSIVSQAARVSGTDRYSISSSSSGACGET